MRAESAHPRPAPRRCVGRAFQPLWAARTLVRGVPCALRATRARVCPAPTREQGALLAVCGRARICPPGPASRFAGGQALLSGPPRHEVRGKRFAPRCAARPRPPRHARAFAVRRGRSHLSSAGSTGTCDMSALPHRDELRSASRCTGVAHACPPSQSQRARSALERFPRSTGTRPPRPATVGEEGTSSCADGSCTRAPRRAAACGGSRQPSRCATPPPST